MAVIITNMDTPHSCYGCPMCEVSRLPFWCMALSKELPFDRIEIYKSIASDCPLKSTDEMIKEIEGLKTYQHELYSQGELIDSTVIRKVELYRIIHKYCDKESEDGSTRI